MKTACLSALSVLAAVLWLAAAAAGQAVTAKVKVTAEQANLREKPDIGSSIVQQVPEGTVLEADRKDGEWYFVRYALEDGGVIGGWIHESLVEVVEEVRPVTEAVKPREPAAPPPRERVRRPPGIGRIEAPEFRTGSIPLEISASAGFATLSPRDLNDGTRGYADWVGDSIGIPAPGNAGIVHLALLAGFELSYRLSPRLALGLGADLFGGSNGDEIVLSDGARTDTVTTRPSVRCVPVKLAVRFYPGSGFYVRGGLGLYAVKAGYLFRQEGSDFWDQRKGSASASGLGGEAAFGGEWAIAPRTDVFVEAGFRMISLEGLTGQNRFTNSGGEDNTDPGTLFYFRKRAAGEEAYPLISVRGVIPSEIGVVEAREARINLSGTAVRAGVRYRF
jgi:hypothetical protein